MSLGYFGILKGAGVVEKVEVEVEIKEYKFWKSLNIFGSYK